MQCSECKGDIEPEMTRFKIDEFYVDGESVPDDNVYCSIRCLRKSLEHVEG